MAEELEQFLGGHPCKAWEALECYRQLKAGVTAAPDAPGLP